MNLARRPRLSALNLLLFCSSVALALPLACSNDPSFGPGDAPCENPDLEDECGKSCDETEECARGLFCDAELGTCQAECVAGEAESEECDDGPCTEDGRCKSGSGSGGSGSGGDGTGGTGEPPIVIGQGGDPGTGGTNPDCIDVVVDFEPQIPNVVLLIDQSGSMDTRDGFGTAVQAEIDAEEYTPWGCPDDPADPPDDPVQQNPTWRWNVVRNVLFNPDTGVVKPLEDQVRFGMALYTSNGGFGLTEPYKTCPTLIEVEVGFGGHADMLAAMECDDIQGDTPTRESLTATAEALAAAGLDGPQVIVVATDGEPDSCTCPNWEDSGGYDCDGDAEDRVDRGGTLMTLSAAEKYDLVAEAGRIYEELGIVVHVIDVSTPSNTSLRDHLTDVAEAGGGDIFDGLNPSNLSDAFQSIIDGVRSCAIDLDGEIAPGKEDTGTVTLNDEELVLGDEDGWRVNSPTQIELLGAACETIKSGSQNLDISFPCGSFTPPGPK